MEPVWLDTGDPFWVAVHVPIVTGLPAVAHGCCCCPVS